MNDIYFISAIAAAIFVLTGLPVRFYLQVTESLNTSKRLYKFRNKLRLMPFLATVGTLLFFFSLSLDSHTGAFMACLITGFSSAASFILALTTLVNSQCRKEAKHTLEARILAYAIAVAGKTLKLLMDKNLKGKRDSNAETNIYHETHEFERSHGRLDNYGNYKN